MIIVTPPATSSVRPKLDIYNDLSGAVITDVIIVPKRLIANPR